MEILVTGEMTYVTKLALKRLVDAGHKLTYRVNGFDSAGKSRDAGETAVDADGDWLIDGVAAFSLRSGKGGNVPLHLALIQMMGR